MTELPERKISEEEENVILESRKKRRMEEFQKELNALFAKYPELELRAVMQLTAK